MKIATLVFAILCAGPLPAISQNADPHLNFVPRTNAEIARIAAITSPTTDFTQAEQFERMTGGATTSLRAPSPTAFIHSSSNLTDENGMDFAIGTAFFEKLWVSSPSATLASNGLGPLYNARSCAQCHPKMGRGHPPEGPDDNAVSMFLRVSIMGGETPDIEEYLSTLPEPTYGRQLQDFATVGLTAEYTLNISYTEAEVTLADGTTVSLRTPTYEATNLAYGPLHPNTMVSPRVAPPMLGLGLLEAIPAADILANADPEDKNGDGISGRANILWSKEFDQPLLGRFSLKANEPTILQQTADAFVGDLGIANHINPQTWGECSEAQTDCRAAPHGGEAVYNGLEITPESMEMTALFVRNLAVPARRDMNETQVLRGKQLFYESGCVACHVPKFVTHRLLDQPEQSFQLIWPYSDLLLHDMGDGLADYRPDGRATGWEWRTPPLWGIGLTETVSGHTYFLHDGRARNLLEAVLWHGGEAIGAREAVVGMSTEDRAALIAFLESL